ncbi:uncharacterized protein LOC126661563 [Mercurialis annua]|uniref:uncharacterized protein LOC126661563 n=1 Tax=Mercurialis annua TaxID=3986 RepID=UPI00215EFA52|nr:uncharacterized protein LOC126661563 [Mercurialis annua]
MQRRNRNSSGKRGGIPTTTGVLRKPDPEGSGAHVPENQKDGVSINKNGREVVTLFSGTSDSATNNVLEYEALIAGLALAVEVRTENLKIHCDSQLVVGQVDGTFAMKEENLLKYKKRAKELLQEIEKRGGQCR